MIRKALALSVFAFMVVVAPAFANAPNPLPGQTRAVSVVPNGNGATITVMGTWEWGANVPSGGQKDCNGSRSGVGYAIAWNDPNDPGNVIPASGAQPAVAVGDSHDNWVHSVTEPAPAPTPPNSANLWPNTGNSPSALTVFGPISNNVAAHTTESMAGTTGDGFVGQGIPTGLSSAAPLSGDQNSWFSNCGPINPTTVTLANGQTLTAPGNTTPGTPTQGFPSGFWGPITHTYTGPGPYTLCAVMYDPHGGPVGSHAGGLKDVIAGGSGRNDDNSVEKNGNAPASCPFSIVIPTLTTQAASAGPVGSTFSPPDAATINGSSPQGTITWHVYGPFANAGAISCTAANETATNQSFTATVNGSGQYTPGASFTPTAAGLYQWTASFAPNANDTTNQPVGPVGCNDTHETLTVNPATPGIVTTATPATAVVSTTVNDEVTLTGGFPAGHPSGTVTWQLVDSSCNAVNGITSTASVNANTVYPLKSPNMTAPSATGTYFWTATFSPSDGNNTTAGPVGCNVPSERLTVSSSPNMKVIKSERDSTTGGSFVTDPNTVSGAVGDTITYEMEVDNNGNVPLTLSATDPKCDGGTPALQGPFTSSNNQTPLSGALAAGSSAFYTCHHVLTNADIGSDAQPGTGYTNTITVTGTPPPNQGSAITGMSSVTAFAAAVPAFTIQKTQTIDGSGQPFTTDTLTGLQGQKIDYRILVTNTGNVPLTFSQFSDPMCDSGTIAGGPGNASVAPGQSTVFTCVHVITEKDQANGSVTNVATITGTPPGGPPTTTPSNQVVVNIPAPGLTILKQQRIGSTDAFTSNTITGAVGDTVDYKMIVTNTGGTSLALTLDDPHCDPGTVSGPFAISGNLSGTTLAAGGQAFFLCSHVLTAADSPSFTNTATATGTPPSGPPVTSPPSSVVVNIPPPSTPPNPGMTVVKSQTVSGSNQPYTTSPVTANPGQTVLYHMTVTNTGNQPLKLSFSDPHCDANTLSGPSGGLDATGDLAVGAQTVYSCSHLIAASDAPAFTNVVTVTGTPPVGPPTPPLSSSVVANVPQQAVAPSCVAGSVALNGTVGCARRAFQAVVQAAPNSVKSVTFLLDGKVIKTLSHAGKGNRWAITVKPGKLRFGGHTLTARVTLICNGARRVATLHFRHCRPPKPRFTG